MGTLLWTFLGLLIARNARDVLGSQGVKCKDKTCSPLEYCSPFDAFCRPCDEACDVNSRNYQPDECNRDCQAYLHDQRYVLRSELEEYEDLRGEVRKLWIVCIVAITLTCFSVLGMLFLLARSVTRWKRFKSGIQGAFSKKWVKTTTVKNNKVQDDAELGAAKQNGLKLTMPTISGTIVGERSAGSGASNDNGTPNTSSTPLSRKYPSEDTTLDYSYDNPAMTPSPEAAQLRTKRESSF